VKYIGATAFLILSVLDDGKKKGRDGALNTIVRVTRYVKNPEKIGNMVQFQHALRVV
jgi:hypothetical protein